MNFVVNCTLEAASLKLTVLCKQAFVRNFGYCTSCHSSCKMYSPAKPLKFGLKMFVPTNNMQCVRACKTSSHTTVKQKKIWTLISFRGSGFSPQSDVCEHFSAHRLKAITFAKDKTLGKWSIHTLTWRSSLPVTVFIIILLLLEGNLPMDSPHLRNGFCACLRLAEISKSHYRPSLKALGINQPASNILHLCRNISLHLEYWVFYV
jgi:hypothetical protein